MARYLFLVILAILSLPVLVNAASIHTAEYNFSEANASLNNATAYVSMVNQSSYLIFSPKLNQSYSYLGEARKLLNSTPGSSILYSKLAISSARQAYSNITLYRGYGFLGALVFTIISGLLLLRFMRYVTPSKAKRKK